MRTADIGLFAWEPRAQRITLGEHLDCDTKRYLTALALAHRALGHMGNDLMDSVEACALAEYWLNDAAVDTQRVAA